MALLFADQLNFLDSGPTGWNCKTQVELGGGNSNIFGIFTPIPGEMIQFDEHIFQMG